MYVLLTVACVVAGAHKVACDSQTFIANAEASLMSKLKQHIAAHPQDFLYEKQPLHSFVGQSGV